MFEQRRLATSEEIAQLIKSFDVIDPPAVLREAEISWIGTLDELRAMHTVLAVPDPAAGLGRFLTVAQNEKCWAAGGGTPHDQQSYRRAMIQADDSAFEPELVFAPTTLTGSGWWMVDAIHRAAALVTKRTAAGVTKLGVRVFVLPRPLE